MTHESHRDQKDPQALLWLSRVIFKVLNQECKKFNRKLESTTIKQISARTHRSFNETCLNIYAH